MTGVRYARFFWIGAAGALVLAALIGISSLLRSEFSETDWQILLTLISLIVSAGTAVAGLSVAERGHSALGWSAVVVAGVSFCLIATATWDEFDSETLAELAGTAAFGLVATLLAATQLVLHRGRHAWLLAVTWVALALAFVLSTSAVLRESGDTWKVAASCWIVGLVGWLNLPVLQRFSAAATPPVGERVLAALDDVELVATRTGDALAIDLAPGERLVLRRRPRS
ncbi:MAG TPA: hypothetical protein VJ807_04100 [Gaiellaceae bacterium]|nr:hypothetical protein [Gaiellaceae bacterium]